MGPRAAEATRRRLQLDAAALELYLAVTTLDAAELARVEAELAREAARRPLQVPTPAQLRALADEVEAWLADRNDTALAAAWSTWCNQVDWPTTAAERVATRDELERWIVAARGDEVAGPTSRTPAWLGGLIAEPADITARIEQTRAEVEAVADEVALLELDAATRAEWLAWLDAFEAWIASEPSTYWGTTITDLEEWDAQLAGHRRRIERAARSALQTPSEPRMEAPAEGIVQRAGAAIQQASSSIATGLGVVAGLVVLGGVLYFANKGSR